jgi:ribonuclease HI
MELMAVLYTLKLLDKNKKFCNNNFRVVPIIYCDSSYVVNIFNNWMYKWEKNNWLKSDNKEIKNLDIIKEIFELKDLARIEKVKGHANNKWNNYADMLATGKVLLEKKG